MITLKVPYSLNLIKVLSFCDQGASGWLVEKKKWLAETRFPIWISPTGPQHLLFLITLAAYRWICLFTWEVTEPRKLSGLQNIGYLYKVTVWGSSKNFLSCSSQVKSVSWKPLFKLELISHHHMWTLMYRDIHTETLWPLFRRSGPDWCALLKICSGSAAGQCKAQTALWPS